jgi:hypothetical protein
MEETSGSSEVRTTGKSSGFSEMSSSSIGMLAQPSTVSWLKVSVSWIPMKSAGAVR